MDNDNIKTSLELMNYRLEIIEGSVKEISKNVDDLVMHRQYEKGVHDTKSSFMTWVSRHGLSIFSLAMAVGAVAWELKKSKP